MNRKVFAIITLLLVSVLLLSACGAAEKLKEYELGTDKIPSINATLGEERKVTGVSTGTDNGVQYKQYTYQSESTLNDLIKYTVYLRNNGWTVTKEYDLNVASGEAQLAKESADSGKILVMSIAFEGNSYAVRINKLDGSLTRN